MSGRPLSHWKTNVWILILPQWNYIREIVSISNKLYPYPLFFLRLMKRATLASTRFLENWWKRCENPVIYFNFNFAFYWYGRNYSKFYGKSYLVLCTNNLFRWILSCMHCRGLLENDLFQELVWIARKRFFFKLINMHCLDVFTIQKKYSAW